MITYAEAEKALQIMDKAFAKAFGSTENKARVVAIDEWDQPRNRKQRRIQASKIRRKKNVSNRGGNGIEFVGDRSCGISMGQDVVESE